jgi:lipid II isoglutaminyl synthase (glutamine-hydrolysing)
VSSLSSLPIRTRLAATAGRSAALVSRRLGRGEGSVIGGRVTLALDGQSLTRLASGRRIALVSGTNGKTTTTSMLAAALNTLEPTVTNLSGANMYGGMVAALSSSPARVAVLETDEAHLPKALEMTKAQFVVLLNLSRDQLDRVGEVRMQAQKWRTAFQASDTTVIANADDPLVVWAAKSARNAIWVAAGNNWRLDAASCPQCAKRIDWLEGEWRCTGCELARPVPHAFFASSKVADRRVGKDLRLKVDLALPGQINRDNASIALTTAVLMGAKPGPATEAVNQLEGVAGRFTTTKIAGVPVRLLLAKNPAGWSEALRIARKDDRPLVVSINARVQDGRDPSWLWDVPYEDLQGRYVAVTGERGRDLAVRLRYANVQHEFFAGGREAVQAASKKFKGTDEIDVIGNYSAFQDFRKLAEHE